MATKQRSPRSGAAQVSKVVSGAVAGVVGSFTVAFLSLLTGILPNIGGSNGLMRTTSLLLYVTIEGAFVGTILFAGYVSLSRKSG